MRNAAGGSRARSSGTPAQHPRGSLSLCTEPRSCVGRLGIQILPSRQGGRIGEAVLRELPAEAAREHVPVSLGVLHGNPARRLYERLGFRLAAETERSATLIWSA